MQPSAKAREVSGTTFAILTGVILAAPMQPFRQMHHFCLSALLLFAGITPFGLQLNAACGTVTSSSMAAMPGMPVVHTSSVQAEQPCPAFPSMNCAMTVACCLTCPAVFATSGVATLERPAMTEALFTVLALTLRNRSTNVASPPHRA